jgi:hypothetical protein
MQPLPLALVAPHQAGVANNVGSDNHRQFALLTGHGNFRRSLQRIVEGVRPVGNRVGEPCGAV